MFKILSITVSVLLIGLFGVSCSSKAQWTGQIALEEPHQYSEDLPAPWEYKNFTITPKAHYHLKAVVLSKHSYWAGDMEDALAKYDLALGWGPMSEAKVINQLAITQGGRWYEYRWKNDPPIASNQIALHSSNNHIVPANQSVLDVIEKIKRNDLIELEGYLIDVYEPKKNWSWHSSLSRSDTAGGSCELMWVTKAVILTQL